MLLNTNRLAGDPHSLRVNLPCLQLLTHQARLTVRTIDGFARIELTRKLEYGQSGSRTPIPPGTAHVWTVWESNPPLHPSRIALTI
jgi:hypothetical protein